MAGCSAVSFKNVSASAFDCLVKKAAKYGVTIGSDSGSASSNGFTVRWNYNRSASSLEIQCTDKPFWAPCGTINSTIKSNVQDCLSRNVKKK